MKSYSASAPSYLKLPRNLFSLIRHCVWLRMNISGILHCIKRYCRIWRENWLEVGEFFEFRLWRRELTLESCLEFIGWRKHIYSLRILSPPQYRCITENKLIFNQICVGAGIDVPKLLGIYDSQVSPTNGLERLTNAADLRRTVETHQQFEVVVKPVEGTRGQCVIALSYDRMTGRFLRPNGDVVTDAQLQDQLSQYSYNGICQTTFLVQSRVLPSPETAKVLSPFVPFSYRFLSLRDEITGPRVIFAYGKSAVGDALADNLHSGGLALLIDEKGVCQGAKSSLDWSKRLMTHPTTNAELIGWRCPAFSSAREIALRAASCFSTVRCVAWDVVVGNDQDGHDVVQLLEGNNPFNYDIQLVHDSGLWTPDFSKAVQSVSQIGGHHSPWS